VFLTGMEMACFRTAAPWIPKPPGRGAPSLLRGHDSRAPALGPHLGQIPAALWRGEQTRSTPSWFLGEIPARLIVDLGSPDEPGEVDLTAERDDARQLAAATRSRENVQFARKHLPILRRARVALQPAQDGAAKRSGAAGTPAAAPPLAPPGAQEPDRHDVEHPKYGHGRWSSAKATEKMLRSLLTSLVSVLRSWLKNTQD